MNILSIAIRDGRERFLPGEEVRGEVLWNLQKAPDKIRLNVFWFTEGQGTQDSEIVTSFELNAFGLSGKQQFWFTLPAAPYSFSGSIITLIWAIEATALSSGERSVYKFIMSPFDEPLTLKSIEAQMPGVLKFLSRFKAVDKC